MHRFFFLWVKTNLVFYHLRVKIKRCSRLQTGTTAFYCCCLTAKVSTYHGDVPASILGVAHYIVPQVPQHVWQVGGSHLGAWRAVAHVNVSKQHNTKESQTDLSEPNRLDTIVTSPVPAPSSITFLSARLYLSWLVSRKWHNTMACF